MATWDVRKLGKDDDGWAVVLTSTSGDAFFRAEPTAARAAGTEGECRAAAKELESIEEDAYLVDFNHYPVLDLNWMRQRKNPVTKTIVDVLTQRGSKYGRFIDNAEFSQAMKDLFRSNPGWANLTADKREAIDLSLTKLSRMLTGDPEYKDNVTDVIGYFTLLEKNMTGEPM